MERQVTTSYPLHTIPKARLNYFRLSKYHFQQDGKTKGEHEDTEKKRNEDTKYLLIIFQDAFNVISDVKCLDL